MLVPPGATPVGWWHTHGTFDPTGEKTGGKNVATRQPGKNGDWIFSPVSPQDEEALKALIADGSLPADAIAMVATSSGHVTLFNSATPPGDQRYFFNPSLYVNLQGIKPTWAGVWYYDFPSQTLRPPGAWTR